MSVQTVCQVGELAKGAMRAFSVANHKIVLYHLDDGFYATQASCTHLFAPLARGKIVDGALIQCPFHRARFDIRTGRVVAWANFPPGVQLLNAVRGEKNLRSYKVTVESGSVRVDIPDGG
jgi:3-phenylpropionate/trans-cinnamate dioxygenase ferredoxin subunit